MDKIAQIIFQPYCHNTVLLETSGLDSTIRGSKGFGSTDETSNLVNDPMFPQIIKKDKSYKNLEFKCMLCTEEFEYLDNLIDHYQLHFNGY